MQVSKQVVGVVAAVFLTLFGAVFYLLGRESTRRRAPAVVVEASEPTMAPAPAMPTMAPPPSAPMPTTAPMPTSVPMPTRAPSAPVVVMPSRAADRAVEPLPEIRTQAAAPPVVGDAAAARDYFTRMQAIQTVGGGSDTSEMANKLLTASMTGDSTGFDDLIKAAQAGAERVRAISPPACCGAYHEHMLALVGDGVALVQQIKRAMQTNDASALAALAASGSALQNRATALDNEATQIKSRLGLAR